MLRQLLLGEGERRVQKRIHVRLALRGCRASPGAHGSIMRDAEYALRIFDVARHLLLQRRDAGKPLFRPQPLHEPDRDQPVVQVTIEVKDEDLNGEGVPTEGRPEADAGRAAIGSLVDVDARRIDGVWRDELVGGDAQVRRGKTELPPALGAVLHRGADDVVTTEELGSGPNLAEQDQPADPRAADGFSTACDGGSDFDGEAVARAEPA